MNYDKFFSHQLYLGLGFVLIVSCVSIDFYLIYSLVIDLFNGDALYLFSGWNFVRILFAFAFLGAHVMGITLFKMGLIYWVEAYREHKKLPWLLIVFLMFSIIGVIIVLSE
jgi:hypothetical protein